MRSVLDVAHDLVCNLQENELLARLVNVFARMPESDRETLIGVLEREVQTRIVSQAGADSMTHIDLRPNPNARLYVRIIEPEDTSDEVDTQAFLRATYSVQRGIDALDPNWRAMVATALAQMKPAARAKIDEFNRTMRGLLDEAARATPPTSDQGLPGDASEPTPPEDGVPSRARK